MCVATPCIAFITDGERSVSNYNFGRESIRELDGVTGYDPAAERQSIGESR